MSEKEILVKLLDKARISRIIGRQELDSVLIEAWGNKSDAGMHCNSMMRRGLIDYLGEGDWEIMVTKEDLEAEEATSGTVGG